MLGCDAGEVMFTSSGSESDNHAVASAVQHAVDARGVPVPHVVTCAIEHPAILEYLIAEAAAGRLTFTAVGVDAAGVVDPAHVAAAVTPDTCLVSIMHANNEVGAVQPVAAVAAAARAANPHVLIHTDAAQSCGKIPVKVHASNPDH
jgi:cysteine desulfurase